MADIFMSLMRDTIYALSSGGLPSGVAVVRISGPACPDALEALGIANLVPRKAGLRWIRRRNGDPIDQGLVLYFPAPNSFTGEDCVELQIHGGRAVVSALLNELSSLPGLRHADAGEFSRRAFDGGRLDLVEIEGLADLITAETEMQRRLAMEQSSGQLSALYSGWAQRLTRARALIEAELDFPEEDDVPGAVSDSLWPVLETISIEIKQHLAGHKAAEIVRDGYKVAIIGRPNSGKSSLINALAKRDIAIVTDIAGTTRDVLGIDLDIGGYLVHVMDTAGIRETDDIVEREGVRRALRSMDQADLILVLKDVNDRQGYPTIPEGKRAITIRTKSDLVEDEESSDDSQMRLSVVTGEGLDSLTKRISEAVENATGGVSTLMPARQRQAELLLQASEKIDEILSFREGPLELRAEYLRQASHSLERITGKIDVEDLLDVIFSEFCIGK